MSKRLRIIKDMIEAEGLVLVELFQSKSYKVKVRAKDGREASFSVPRTPSTHMRGDENMRAAFRRFARGTGGAR